jgi:arabinofuranan 3-O-arabinosyltransferase
VHVDEWSATRRLVTVEPHSQDLVLAVRENTNLGWVATIGGAQLAPLVVDGWQQGWVVPAGVSGQIELRYAPDASYRTALLVGAVLVLVVLLAALLVRRRVTSTAPPVSARPVGGLVALGIGAIAFVVTAGVLGGVIAAAGIAAWLFRGTGSGRLPAPLVQAWERMNACEVRHPWVRLRSWLRLARWLLPAVLLILASIAWVLAQSGTYHWIPQTLGILAVATLWVETLVTTPRSAASRR